MLFGRFWRSYLRPYLPVMLIAFLVMMIEGSTLGLLSYMLEPLFDRVFAKGGSHALAWVGGAILTHGLAHFGGAVGNQPVAGFGAKGPQVGGFSGG